MKKVLIFIFLIVMSLTICVSATSVEQTEEIFSMGQWLKENVTAERITAIISTVFSSILTVVIVKLGKIVTKSKEINAVEIQNTIEKGINEKLGEKAEQIINPLVEQVKIMERGVHSIVKSIALLQDGSPQSKLAMYDLIEQSGIVDSVTINECKQDVLLEIEKQEQKKEETKKQLKEIENVSLPVD